MRVLVVDHDSSDETRSIARARGAEVIVRAFEGFVAERRFALSQVVTPWTLMIDADEALDARLRDAVMDAPEDFTGYLVSRTTYYCGKPLRMWTGESLLRLFRTDGVRIEAAPAAGGSAELHERWIANGATAMLDGTLLHFSYPTATAYREKFERYTSVEAQGLAPSRSGFAREALRVLPRFLWLAIARGAALDGRAGLRVAWYSALYPAAVQSKALRAARAR